MLSLRRATHPHQCLSPLDSLCEGATSVGIQPTHNIQNQLGWDLMLNFLCCSWYLSEEQDSDGGRHPNTQLVDYYKGALHTVQQHTQHMHCNVWVLLTRQCMCAIDNCSVILGFGVQVNVLVVVFVHFKVFIGVKAKF